MGKIKNNLIAKSFSGKLGDDLVIRRVGKNTYFIKRPVFAAPPSTLQTENRNKFAEASMYASTALEKPDRYQQYMLVAQLQKLKSAYVAAMTDYLTLPLVASVNTRTYRGAVGDTLSITPKLPAKITVMKVTIINAEGAELESGDAVPHGLKWRYTTTVANTQVHGSRVVVVSKDRLGKEARFEQVLM